MALPRSFVALTRWCCTSNAISALIFGMACVLPTRSNGQTSPYRHGGWNVVAHYTSRHRDQTGALLKTVGYRVPKQYKDKWARMPAARKVDMAYRAAE